MGQVNDLHFATDEERARIGADILSRIEQYECSSYSAQICENQELIRDEDAAAKRREEAMQREAEAAQTAAERHQAYSALRIAVETRMYATLNEINSRYWLNEREKMREIEAAHRNFAKELEQEKGDFRRIV